MTEKEGYTIPKGAVDVKFNDTNAVNDLILAYHYSHRKAGSVTLAGSLHFWGFDEAIAAATFSTPPTRWSEPVLELSRLVRHPKYKPPLTYLISACCRELKNMGYDLLVSFADNTQKHQGYIYQACSWNYHGKRPKRMDGLIIDGVFVAGRTCNARFGTQSPTKLQKLRPDLRIIPHYDEGKFLYWKALNNKGRRKAIKLKLEQNKYIKYDKPWEIDWP